MVDFRGKKTVQIIAFIVALILGIVALGFVQGVILEQKVSETTTTS